MEHTVHAVLAGKCEGLNFEDPLWCLIRPCLDLFLP